MKGGIMTLKNRFECGFTTIELIVCLVLLGVLAMVFCLGTDRLIEGYIFSRETATAAMNVQVALHRMEKELSVTSSVSTASSRAITFSSYRTSDTQESHTLSWSGKSGAAVMLDGSSLLNSVSDFSLVYYDSYNGSAHPNWSDDRTIIGISATVKVNGSDVTFSTRVVPRNL